MKEILSPCGKYKILVDDEDYEHLSKMRWGVSGKSARRQYAFTGVGKGRSLSMHRYLLGLKPHNPLRVDHKDGNGLNNQRSNIRIATQSQNGCNKPASNRSVTGIKGVLFCQKNPWKYRVFIRAKCVGTFESLRDAMATYNEAAEKAWGEFAWQHDLSAAAVANHQKRLNRRALKLAAKQPSKTNDPTRSMPKHWRMLLENKVNKW